MYHCTQKTAATGREALLILRRLSYPNRWCDLVPLFGRSESELSLIFNEVSVSVVSDYCEVKQSYFAIIPFLGH